MTDTNQDTLMRMVAFEHVQRLGEVYDHLTAKELKPGFDFKDKRIRTSSRASHFFGTPQHPHFAPAVQGALPPGRDQ